jgi:hypothetical protein
MVRQVDIHSAIGEKRQETRNMKDQSSAVKKT